VKRAARKMDSGRLREASRRPLARRNGLRERLRALAALHGLAFFVAVVVAPHSHWNSFEDLLSDGPSDSGIFIEVASPANLEPGLQFRAARLVDDDPCPACFHDDFKAATEPVSSILIASVVAPLPKAIVTDSPIEPAPPSARRQSRAPPPAA
jgi:hypothetical protein